MRYILVLCLALGGCLTEPKPTCTFYINETTDAEIFLRDSVGDEKFLCKDGIKLVRVVFS